MVGFHPGGAFSRGWDPSPVVDALQLSPLTILELRVTPPRVVASSAIQPPQGTRKDKERVRERETKKTNKFP
jgi:hypothetical protein